MVVVKAHYTMKCYRKVHNCQLLVRGAMLGDWAKNMLEKVDKGITETKIECYQRQSLTR